ncbi:putative methylthioribose kinase 1 [Apostichopus japonicus]|uniref:Putative methylthioribose kinase 1 n=1 Tax=Stichopus japonicus TaxID=307972 RepID=A0A2G8JPC0_STIJA|nr:putative methylthioribose kinase 1 [Apostichopus japonicus]
MDIEHIKTILRNVESQHTFTKFLKTDDLSFTEPGVGNVNYVMRVSSKTDPRKTVIVKLAGPIIKVLGPNYPLDKNRNNLERKALRKLHDVCPGQVPEVFHWDKEESFMIMQDLKHYEDMNWALMRGDIKQGAFRNIVEFATTLHRVTHKKYCPEEEFEVMKQTFRNETMRNVHYTYVFTCPWIKDHPANFPSAAAKEYHALLYENKRVVSNTLELREIYMTKKECLLHGDMHSGSVMTNGEDVKIIDAELVCVGPQSLDLAFLLAHFLYFYHVHRIYPRKDGEDFASRLRTMMCNAVKQYFQEISTWLTEKECETIIQEVVGFTGCEMCKRTFSAAHYHESDDYPLAEQSCIRQGVKLIENYKEIKTIEDLMNILQIDSLPSSPSSSG